MEALYRALKHRGLDFGPAFQGIDSLWKGQGEAIGRVLLNPSLVATNEGHRLHPCLLDACSQVVAATLTPAAGSNDLYMLVSIERLTQYALAGEEVWCHVRLLEQPDADRFRADVSIFNAEGKPVATITGLTYQRVGEQKVELAVGGNGHTGANGHSGSNGNGHANGHGSLRNRLRLAHENARHDVLESHVRDHVARILGLSDPPDSRTGFFDLGMDSLSASELVSTLGRDLGKAFPATVLFDYGNSGALARYLLEEVSLAPSGSGAHGNAQAGENDHSGAAKSASGNGHANGPADLDALSTDEMAALFARMLDDLKGPTP